MSIGEKRLQSLINATVSHEMRNPLNSIHIQVKQIKRLNEQMRELVESFKDELPHGFISDIDVLMSRFT